MLAGEPLHGYAIRQEVEDRTDGDVRLWPATLYGTLKDLTGRGWIEETESPAGEDGDSRRRYYALSGQGRRALSSEVERLEDLASLARRRLTAGEAS